MQLSLLTVAAILGLRVSQFVNAGLSLFPARRVLLSVFSRNFVKKLNRSYIEVVISSTGARTALFTSDTRD